MPSVSRGLIVKESIFYQANFGLSDDIQYDLKLSAVDYWGSRVRRIV